MIAVLTVLLAVEVGSRAIGSWLSQDVRNIRTIPRVALELSNSREYKVLFLGNSLTRVGVDESVVSAEFAKRGRKARVARVYLDDTTINTWQYVFRQHFAKECRPDLLVVGFVDRQLEDLPADYRRLGGIAVNLRMLWEMSTVDAKDLDRRVELVLGYTFFSFSNAERVRHRVLDALVPGYRIISRTLNESAVRHRNSSVTGKSYFHLLRLMNAARENHVEVVLAAMPLPAQYSLEPELNSIIAAGEATLIDARKVEGLRPQMFFDGFHLDRKGAALFSRDLCRLLTTSAAWKHGS